MSEKPNKNGKPKLRINHGFYVKPTVIWRQNNEIAAIIERFFETSALHNE
jgi:hypothetical protein